MKYCKNYFKSAVLTRWGSLVQPQSPEPFQTQNSSKTSRKQGVFSRIRSLRFYVQSHQNQCKTHHYTSRHGLFYTNHCGEIAVEPNFVRSFWFFWDWVGLSSRPIQHIQTVPVSQARGAS